MGEMRISVNIMGGMGIDNDYFFGNYPKNENKKVRSFTFLIFLSSQPLNTFRGL